MAIKSFLSEGGFSVGSVGSTPIEVIDSSGNITAVGLTLSGNLTVNGSTTTINSTITTLDDPIFTLGGDTIPVSDDNKDRGIEFRWHTGSLAKVGFFGFDDSTGKFIFIPDATNTSEVFSGTKGTIDANIEWSDVLNKPDPVVTVTLTGDVTGTANATLTDLGNGTITVATTIAANSIALGTDTTGNYVASITNGSYITGGNGGSEGAALTLAVDATSANTASKVVARDASGNFSAGVITGTRLEARNSGTTQIYIDSTTSGSKEIVFQNNSVVAGYVWASGTYLALGGGSASTSLHVITASGNTGIGTASPGGRLEINSTAAAGATALILRTSDSSANGAIRWQNNTGVNGAGIGSNFNVSDVGALEFLNGTTTNVIFRSSGNVGIGTTAPDAKLHVAGTHADESADRAATTAFIVDTRTNGNGDGKTYIKTGWVNSGNYGVSTLAVGYFASTRQVRDVLTMLGNGNVGIGTTSPTTKLHVAGTDNNGLLVDADTAPNIRLKRTNDIGATGNIDWVGNTNVIGARIGVNDNIAGSMQFKLGGTGVVGDTKMIITSAGNVGIGTTTPAQKLAVVGGNVQIEYITGSVIYTPSALNTSPRLTLVGQYSTSGTYNLIRYWSGAAHDWSAGTVTQSSGDADYVFQSRAGSTYAERVRITSGGNVGIGVSSPAYKLDVSGRIAATGSTAELFLDSGALNSTITSYGSGVYKDLWIRTISSSSDGLWIKADTARVGIGTSAPSDKLHVVGGALVTGGVYNQDSGIRIVNPGGAAYSTTTATITGAFKIKLPTGRYKSDTMLRMTVKIYQYNTGQSLTFNIGGYNNNHATNTWLNVFAEQESDSNANTFAMRFGDDGTSNCIWIGETGTTWAYPQVFVTDFTAGFSGTTSAWASGWSITAVTAFDTVYVSRTPAIKVTSNNLGTYGVSSITGTANQVIASGSSGAVTLSLPQNIHTGATPTFSTLTLSGDVLTLSGSGISAYTNSTARIYNQAGVGPTINGNAFELRTGSSGTVALSVSSAQNTALAGTTASTSTTTGALTVAGGVGVAGAINAGTQITIGGTGGTHKLYVEVSNASTTLDSANVLAVANTNATTGNLSGIMFVQQTTTLGAGVVGIHADRTAGARVSHLGLYSTTANTVSEKARLTGTGYLLLGTTADSSNGRLQLAAHTTSAGGIGFGTDVTLYRSAANVLKTDDALTIAGALNVTNDGNLPTARIVNIGGTDPRIALKKTGDTTSWEISSGDLANTFAVTEQNVTRRLTIAANGVTSILGTGSSLTIQGTTASTSTTTGALQVAGGVGIAGALYNGGAIVLPSSNSFVSATSGRAILAYTAAGGMTITGAGSVNDFTLYNKTGSVVLENATGTQNVKVVGTTASTSTTTGALTVAGGVGVAGSGYFGASTYVAPAVATNVALFVAQNTGGSLFTGIDNSTGSNFAQGNYAGVLWHTGNNKIVIGTNNTVRLTVAANGNVGIGTTAPNAKLHVSGAAVMSRFQTGTATDGRIEFAFNTTDIGYLNMASATQLDLLARSGVDLAFGSGGSERMRLKAGGNVLFGTTTDSSNGRLQLADHTTAAGGIGFGTDVNLYRSAANTLKTDDSLVVSGSLDIAASYQQSIVTVAALDINCSLGNYFIKTIAANSTFTFSSAPASRAFVFTLELTHTSGTVTWPTAVQWPGGTAPSLTSGKTHLFTFVTDDGGTRWRGASQVNYTN